MELSDIKKGDLFVDDDNNYYVVTLLPFHCVDLDIGYVFGVTELDSNYWTNNVRIVHIGTKISPYNGLRIDKDYKPSEVFNSTSEGYYIEKEDFAVSPLSQVTALDSLNTTVTNAVTSFDRTYSKKKIWLKRSDENPLDVFKQKLNKNYEHAKRVVDSCRVNLNEAENRLKKIEEGMSNSAKRFTDWLYEIKTYDK